MQKANREPAEAAPAEAEGGEGIELIQPPVDLRSRVRVLSAREAAQFDPVKQAELALSKLSVNFQGWLEDQIGTLVEAYGAAAEAGFESEARLDLFRAAHDLRGQAATLGFPLAGDIAGSLCHLLDNVPAAERLPKQLMRQHVDAIRAVVNEGAADENHVVGRQLCERLRAVTYEFVDAERARTA